jgi:hypothetical protein
MGSLELENGGGTRIGYPVSGIGSSTWPACLTASSPGRRLQARGTGDEPQAERHDMQEEADRRLAAALEEGEVADPHGPLRRRLKSLKGSPAFDEAVRHYQEVLVPGVADGSLEPLAAWLDYARLLARTAGPGREVALDVEGRVSADGLLLLHIPEERGAPVTPLRVPGEPSPAQKAALMLLVERRSRL